MTIKLNLLFLLIDLFILLAYPIVLIHDTLRRFSFSKGKKRALLFQIKPKTQA